MQVQAMICQERQALASAQTHYAERVDAEGIRESVLYGYLHFGEAFADAVVGDFLAETDPRRLFQRYRGKLLQDKLAANQRAVAAQRALHSLYRKLLEGTALTLEEQALALHTRDLVEAAVDLASERRSQGGG